MKINCEREEMLSIFDDSRKGELLFHYTSLNNAIAILSTQSLLFGKISKLNDMNESWRPIYCNRWEDNTLNICDEELSSYVQISLTCEDNPEVKDSRRGFDIATMWGHYAEGGNGVCLAFNRCRLFDAISRVPDYNMGYIHYQKEYDCAVLFETSNPKSEIMQRINEIFFCKSDQWRYEQEYRIIKKKSETVDFIDITGCVEGILYARLGADRAESVYNTNGHWALEKVCRGIPLFGYNPHSIDGNRVIFRDDNGKEVWSTGNIVDLDSGEWRIG